jgi:hypothetical protein
LKWPGEHREERGEPVAYDRTDDDLVAMITWALDRILKGDFAVVRDAAGNIESLELDEDLNPLSGVIELDVVELTLEKLLPKEKLSALMSLLTFA